MRHQGRIAEWHDDRGFGFITPLNDGTRVFAHIGEFPRELRRPEALDLVSYELCQDERGRPRASKVQFLAPTASRSPGRRSGGDAVSPLAKVAIAVPVVILLVSALVIGRYAGVLLAVYLVVSAITYAVYGMDKSAAQRGEYRTEESALHLLALAGGWPGALLAQQRFHHKNRKRSFQTLFWVTVWLNCAMLILLIGLITSVPG
ncbi:MAG: cold shock and DUF1294 domain-containing protein [Actinobacteria bacterium]|nr:cold shock and DUF1294 domain-containing protein [Actinomycetota bacterium]MCG2807865.1 cold shock and DUF1294 domain-containing protein [Coriobacteriia bacterium]